MKPDIAQKIIHLNHQFYQNFAGEFSDTRGRLQPGVQKLISDLPEKCRILDLGCGNGELARQLALGSFQGGYLGTDFSANLLEGALKKIPENFQAEFIQLDLTDPDWGEIPSRDYDRVFCFAALHHIPDQNFRLAICKKIRELINSSGLFYLSNWQFLKSERLLKRILPWSDADLTEVDVDPGDYLLDWRRGGLGLRYVHHFDIDELNVLAGESGFRVVDSFDSDGKEGNLSLYQIWEPA
jgi:tRNA (uracil-5-)-methyltransferase TRM9